MSTNAQLFIHENNQLKGIYIHWDGDTAAKEITSIAKTSFNSNLKETLNHIFQHPQWSSIIADPKRVASMAGGHISHDPKIGNYYNDADPGDYTYFKNTETAIKNGLEYVIIVDKNYTTLEIYTTFNKKLVDTISV